jgi:RNA polymerase sigma-70 factor, ECF subfamily
LRNPRNLGEEFGFLQVVNKQNSKRSVMKFFQRSRKNYKTMSDSELVDLAGNDKEAFGELYERYLTKIYNYVYYRTGNAQDAEDLTAKVFFRAMSHIQHYEDKGVPFQAWLYRIAHNLVANFHRDQGRRKIIPLDDYVAQSLKSEAPDKQAEANEEQEQLLAAIRRLPAERQELLLLKFIEQKSNAEIGDMMSRTEGAIKSLYHRTLLALRDELAQTQPTTLPSTKHS